MAKTSIIELDIDVDAIVKKSQELKVKLESLRSDMAKLKAAGDTSSEGFVKLDAALKSTSAQYNLNQKLLQNFAETSGNYLSIQQKMQLGIEKEITSIASARSNNSELLKIRNELNLKTAEGAKAAEEINKKIDANNAFIKENVSAYEKQKINIGNYTESIKQAIDETGIFGGEIQKVTNVFQNFAPVFNTLKQEFSQTWQQMNIFGQSAWDMAHATTEATESVGELTTGQKLLTAANTVGTVAINATSGALKLLRIALISTGVGAIVVALGALVAYLTSTQEGIDKVTAITRPLQAIFQALLGLFQNVGKALFDAFSNPKKLLSDLADFVKQNLINRFTAFGKILEGIMDLDFKKVTDGALQAATGVENMTDKIANGAKATGKFLADAAKQGAEIDRLQKKLDKGLADYTKRTGELKEEFKAQNLIAEDTNKTYAEREAAAVKSIQVAKEMNKLTLERLDLEIKLMKQRQALNDTSDKEKAELAELIAKRNEANAQMLEMETTQNNKVNSIRKEAASAAAQARQAQLDEAVKTMQAELDLFIQTSARKSKTLENELEIARQVRDQRLKIAQTEFEASKKTQSDRLKLIQAQNDAQDQYAEAQLKTAADFAKAELDLFLSNNRSKLEGAKELTQELIDEEAKRIETVKTERLNMLAIEKQTSQEIIDRKRANNEQLTTADLEYLTARNELELEAQRQLEANKEAFEQQTKQRRAEQLAIEREIALANAASEFEERQLRIQSEYDDELARYTDLLEKKKITREQYEQLETSAREKKAEAERISRLENVTGTLDQYSKMTAALTAWFGKNKALASATALINGGLAVTEILKAPATPFVEPFASITRGIQIAGAVATTTKNLAQIHGAKLARGGLIDRVKKIFARKGTVVRGASHAEGGVPFTIKGSDVVHEMEGDEIILTKGVSRNPLLRAIASKINVAAGGVQFAGGGIPYPTSTASLASQASAQLIDIDAMAAKIAEANAALPAPVVYTAVTDINTGQGNYAQVVDGANL